MLKITVLKMLQVNQPSSSVKRLSMLTITMLKTL